MESNQITCPQCGLANNALADACIQCGIIFMKKSAKETPAAVDLQKRKAPEATEAKPDETRKPPEIDAFTNEIIKRPDSHEDRVEMPSPKRKAPEAAEAKPNETRKPPEIDAFTNEIIKRPDPHEDTVEMPIPKEAPVEEKSEASAPEKPEPEADKNSGNLEIEMEAIEAAMESVNETVDAEALFLSEVNPDLPAQTAAPVNDPKQVGTLPEPEKADDPRGAIVKPDADKAGGQDSRAEAQPQKQPAGSLTSGSQKQENLMEKESGMAQAEAAKPAKTEKAETEVAAAPKGEDHSIPGAMAQPPEKEIKSEQKPAVTVAETSEAPSETKTIANATLEMPRESTEAKSRENQLAEKAKQDALKKQQEAQVQAEALEKQKAAKAEALKKKKLAQARAEALRNQRVAEIKAEALKKKKEAQVKAEASAKQEAARAKADVLKKQKEAQARAEASSGEMQLASNGMPQAAAGTSHHERLLGLLKRYKGKAIGINYDNSSEIREAELVDANEEFFSVTVKEKKLQYSYPLKTILTIVEGQEGGVETGECDKKAKFDAVIKVYPLVPF
jgi:hypothetical protein